ncbi:radical SAM protein [Kutzneria sp. 744]|uniref:radical SAM protein n=1 Tax=Kutzneria sp. (strain 744) TaxID=345341 RepID=UPI0003EEC765|nr:radical SAM protein [Kutzneria sp. 744]EWM10508.1 radical SAM domain-containing protein [Kutzneria sp. 744]
MESGPRIIVWDTTYACPLLCVHCYSESGRRPTRQLDPDTMLLVADKIAAAGPESVVLSGGEPLLTPVIADIARRLSQAGVQVVVYTGGWSMRPELAEQLASTVSLLGVSVDGATAEVHDKVRGRRGAFDRALRSLAILDEVASRVPFNFGLDCSVMRSNFHQLDDICATVAPRFPRLGFAYFGPVVPSGAASRAGFDAELLTDDQVRELTSDDRVARLRSLAGDGVDVQTTDNRQLMMHPDRARDWSTYGSVQIEPDGQVRAMSIYEGTVGNIRTDPPSVLWERALARWHDPFVVETLGPVRTMAEWAVAARRIDQRFGSPDDLRRIARRPA